MSPLFLLFFYGGWMMIQKNLENILDNVLDMNSLYLNVWKFQIISFNNLTMYYYFSMYTYTFNN